MGIREIMTGPVKTVRPAASLQEAASKMRDLDMVRSPYATANGSLAL